MFRKSSYQTQQIIQNTVRVDASLYTFNKGALVAANASANHNVCWNQMSDRPVPSVSKATIPTGYNTSANRRRTSVTSSRPGCQTPGGRGCDIKHNSYDRYLNRLKGKGPLRRGTIPSTYGLPVPFNNAFPVYGDKTIKTSIVNGCNCSNVNSNLLYTTTCQQLPQVSYVWTVGQYVYAIAPNDKYYSKAIITAINGSIYTITFVDTDVTVNVTVDKLSLYFPCANC